MSPFTVIVLGCTGGPFDGNTSAYLLYNSKEKEVISLDGGTLLHGLKMAHEKGTLDDFALEDPLLTPVGAFFRHHIKAYLITHVHLDHIAGLVCASQADSKKALLGSDYVVDYIRDHIFNGKVWANFGSEGKEALHLYTYLRLKEKTPTPIPGTHLHVESFFLNHAHDYPSTAFLIKSADNYLLYFGDTSSDALESEKRNISIWHRVAPLIKEKKLRGIIIECSYPNSEGRPLFGHLNPHLLLQELDHLASLAQTSLQGLKVLITHRKESLLKGKDPKERIAAELLQSNRQGVTFIFPQQGEKILF